MFYGIVEECYLYEFNFKEAKDILKQRIKNAILRFIDKIDAWLDKHKDSKIKSLIQSLLQKVRKLLVRCDGIETESDAKAVVKDLDEYSSQFKENTDIKFEHVDIHISDEKLDKIRNYCNDYINKLIESFKKYNDTIETKYDFKNIRRDFETSIHSLWLMITSSIYSILNDELLKTELYSNNEHAKFFESNYYSRNILIYFNKQANILADNFKLKTYNGENIDKYLENFRDHITNKIIAFAHSCEANFNKMTRDSEIKTYNEIQERQNRFK